MRIITLLQAACLVCPYPLNLYLRFGLFRVPMASKVPSSRSFDMYPLIVLMPIPEALAISEALALSRSERNARMASSTLFFE